MTPNTAPVSRKCRAGSNACANLYPCLLSGTECLDVESSGRVYLSFVVFSLMFRENHRAYVTLSQAMCRCRSSRAMYPSGSQIWHTRRHAWTAVVCKPGWKGEVY